MAAFIYRDMLTSPLSPAEARQRVTLALLAIGAALLSSSDVHVDLQLGNERRLRFRGALLTPVEDLPIEIRVLFEGTSHGCTVVIIQSDSMGAVSRTGLRSKYEQAMGLWANHTRAALGAEPIQVALA